jgi:hypothetical protein
MAAFNSRVRGAEVDGSAPVAEGQKERRQSGTNACAKEGGVVAARASREGNGGLAFGRRRKKARDGLGWPGPSRPHGQVGRFGWVGRMTGRASR